MGYTKKYYTIYNNKTDEIVASGYLEECAKQFDTNKRCMSSIISKITHGIINKYCIVSEIIEDEELDDFNQ